MVCCTELRVRVGARRTSDDDLAGLDLSGVLGIISERERIHAATIRRFTERFARFNLPADTLRPSYRVGGGDTYVALGAERSCAGEGALRLREIVGRCANVAMAKAQQSWSTTGRHGR